ncbi:MAG: tRNA preQ1(34) S-adenosylmethionine ribosyltransferase-isomerase QueA [Candidatus Melainabacteria bacterium RIFCSPHIGHO2_02_FULL_34_12]|nr:MAG: tRNA preQ1(34) S-adenosylmethionine ribosyltransferase-isomerase QueA [Candidatus Melainabacteria bacterium RIFCSPHIGHO2_02_FULL_34_12]
MNDALYKLETYNYSLPKELIAQYPAKNRDESRLLCFKKDKNAISHHVFCDLPGMLSNNDVLVLNNTKVIPARFYAKTESGKEVEILLVSSVSPDNLIWKILASSRKNLKPGLYVIARSTEGATEQSRTSLCKSIGIASVALLPRNDVKVEIIDQETIRFKSHEDLKTILEEIGQMPLPPYIKRTGVSAYRRIGERTEGHIGEEGFSDFERYQTIFAKEPGAVAAPTAALHFTEELLNKIKSKGVEILYITLHVGPGTFLPVRTDDIREHKLIPESFYIDPEVWGKIQTAKNNKKRIIACGSTTVRALEYASMIDKFSGLNSLYIMPGFEFKVVDALITNFHLPKTTLLVLVSAFIGWENVKNIYNEAIKEKYRFFSYGDAMFLHNY